MAARKKTVLGGLSIGPDVELLILVGGGIALIYWLWTKYGSNALTSIEGGVSNAVSDVTGSVDSVGTDAGI